MSVLESNVSKCKKELARAIQAYAKSQKKLWQQIPYLALQADGQLGFSETYQVAYAQGYWTIERNLLYLDCATGKLVDHPKTKRLATDSSVILASTFVHALDAQIIMEALRKVINSPRGISSVAQAEEKHLETWHQGIMAEHQLGPVYVRRP